MAHELVDGAHVGVRRPDALPEVDGAEFIAVRPVLVRPQLVEAVELAEVAHEEAAGVHLEPLRGLLAELLHHGADRARREGVHAQFVEVAPLAGAVERVVHGRADEDVALHRDAELGEVGGPDAVRYGLGAHVGALLEGLVRPEVEYLVERADVRVPEADEGGELRAGLYLLGEAALHLGHRVGREVVGTQFVDHPGSSAGKVRVSVAQWAAGCREIPSK